jgi:hypothetical protein
MRAIAAVAFALRDHFADKLRGSDVGRLSEARQSRGKAHAGTSW